MKRNNEWMSVSDLMTGLMVIFLFVSIAYMIRVDNDKTVLKDFVDNRHDLHEKLCEQFKSERDNGVITIGGDLSMRFNKAETLFDEGSWVLKDDFKKQLSEILPKYFEVLLKDSLKSKIREVRIEGHTNTAPYPSIDPDPYIANLILSQRRALSVMCFMRELPEYKKYSPEDQKLLEYWFTATGFSYGHAIDKNDDLAFSSHNPIDQEKSRRVELRIITSSEDLLENFVNHNYKKTK